jgi:phosphotransferase system HPr (HPr) family protein
VLKRCLSLQFLAKHHPDERIVQLCIANCAGLHARASCRFVQSFNRWNGTFPDEQRPNVIVSKDGQEVNPASIMGVMLLVASRGSVLLLFLLGLQSGPARALLALDRRRSLTRDTWRGALVGLIQRGLAHGAQRMQSA